MHRRGQPQPRRYKLLQRRRRLTPPSSGRLTAPLKSNVRPLVNEESSIIFDRKPDRLELSIRAVCGALLGMVFGVYFWLRWFLDLEPWAAAVLIVTLSACSAFAAARYGDPYWERFLGRIWIL